MGWTALWRQVQGGAWLFWDICCSLKWLQAPQAIPTSLQWIDSICHAFVSDYVFCLSKQKKIFLLFPNILSSHYFLCPPLTLDTQKFQSLCIISMLKLILVGDLLTFPLCRNRLPMISDDLSHWSDIFTWRQHHYQFITNHYDSQNQQDSVSIF